MAAEYRLLSFVIVMLTISLFCFSVYCEVCHKAHIIETKSRVLLRAEDRSKAQVILSYNNRLYLVIYATLVEYWQLFTFPIFVKHTVKARCLTDGFPVYRRS